MSRMNLAAAAATAALLFAAPGAASASGQITSAGSADSSARIAGPSTSPAPSTGKAAVAKKNLRVQIGATTGVIYLNKTETKQVGQGGAWVVAGAIGVALAPSTAGVGTIAAVAVGLALGAVGSKLIDQQLAGGQCLKVSTPWISLGTSAKIGWYPCSAY